MFHRHVRSQALQGGPEDGTQLGSFNLQDAATNYYFDVKTTAKRLRFEVVSSSGGNTGVVEIEVYAKQTDENFKAEGNISKNLKVTGKAVICPFAEAGMDIDKPRHLEIVTAGLQKGLENLK